MEPVISLDRRQLILLMRHRTTEKKPRHHELGMIGSVVYCKCSEGTEIGKG